jgi:O-antigen ligase
MFLFLAAVFFLCEHDLYLSKRGPEAFNASPVGAAVTEGSLSRRIVFLSLGLFGVASLVRRRGARLQINSQLGRIMVFFAGWAVLSLVWAEDTALTLRRLVVFAILCIAAAAIARTCSLREIVLLTFFCSALFLVIGMSAEIALGTFRPFAPGYRFAGTQHWTYQGINCALLLLSGVAAGDIEKRRRMLFRACALLGLIFLILTATRGAFAAAFLALSVYLIAVCSGRAKIILAPVLGIVFCAVVLIFGNTLLADVKSAVMLGRDDSTVDSFTGRTAIWEDCRKYIEERPVLGYGYGSFWNERHIAEISNLEDWEVAGGHSSYIDCLLDLGLVGLAAYFLVLLSGVGRSFALYRASHAHAFAFSAAFLIFCLADGLLESVMLEGTLLTFLSILALVRLGFVCGPEATEGSIGETCRHQRRGLHLQRGRYAS